jgi:uncharacterized LabA/DUF88 family protein
MINKYTKGETAVFVDASNIYFSQRELKWQVDFKKLIQYLKQETDLWKIFFYTAYDSSHKQQKKFLDFLEIIGYVVRTKKVKFIKGKDGEIFHKGNLDVELTIDAVHNKDNFNSFLLFSGDSDFEALIKYLKKYHKRCLVFSIKDHVSVELLKQAKFINIKKLKKYIKR